MAYNYEMEVGFHEDTANPVTQEIYSTFLQDYKANGIGHKKTETSTVVISSEKELTKGELERALGEDIPILSFEKRQ